MSEYLDCCWRLSLILHHQHFWPTTIEAAIPLQQELRALVSTHDQLPSVGTVAGVDVGFEDEGRTGRAAVAVLDWPTLSLREHAIARKAVALPYVPGFLSFREVPVVLEALSQLSTLPDLLLVDGQGYAHPRRFGIACHLGLLLDVPTIGVAKSRLIGRHEPVPDKRGSWRALWDKGEVIGAVVRTKPRTNPLYISTGHRVSLETALSYVMGCLTKYRLPETTRWAHRLASELPDPGQLSLF